MIKLALTLYVLVLLFAVTHPAHAANETAQVYDRRGNLFASIEGDETGALVTIDARWRDGELVHTHIYPGLPDLSFADLRTAYAANLRRMCAVSVPPTGGQATCCAERIGRSWQPISRTHAAEADRGIYRAIKGFARETQIAIHHAIVVADAAQRGYTYVCA